MVEPESLDDVPVDDFEIFLDKFFSKPPGEPCSCRILPERNRPFSDSSEFVEFQALEHEHFLCQVLWDILQSGCQILFGHQQAHTLTPQQIDTLQAYFRSFGFEFVVLPCLSTQANPTDAKTNMFSNSKSEDSLDSQNKIEYMKTLNQILKYKVVLIPDTDIQSNQESNQWKGVLIRSHLTAFQLCDLPDFQPMEIGFKCLL